MARPTINPRGTNIGGEYIDGQIRGPAIGTNAIGLTQAATALERNLTVNTFANTPATGHSYVVFRAPPSGATITAAYVTAGAQIIAATTEADTWAFRIKNSTTGNNLNALGASLSDVTLAATAWKTIPIDNGNATVLSGHTLSLSTGVSGSPAAMNRPAIAIEWVPYSNS